jgi:hypothetical protein
MRGRLPLQIALGLLAGAGALLLFDGFVDGPEPTLPAARGRSDAPTPSAAAPFDADDPAAASPFAAQRTEEAGLAGAGIDRRDPGRVAQCFIDALFTGDVETAATMFTDAKWDPESGRAYLSLFHSIVVKKGYSKVAPGSLRCEVLDSCFDDFKVANVTSEGRGLLLLDLHRELGGWSVSGIE